MASNGGSPSIGLTCDDCAAVADAGGAELSPLEEFLVWAHVAGLKRTRQRDYIVRLCFALGEPFTVEGVVQRVNLAVAARADGAPSRPVGYATVHRTVKLLIQSGMLDVVAPRGACTYSAKTAGGARGGRDNG
jgi:Fe2+ or Zn2+ uptake regulation protein